MTDFIKKLESKKNLTFKESKNLKYCLQRRKELKIKCKVFYSRFIISIFKTSNP